MTVYFKRPTNKPNWRKAIEKLIPAAPSAANLAVAAATSAAPPMFIAALVGFGANAQKAIFDAVEAADPDHSIDERAWVWLRVSLTIATVELLNARELRTSLDKEESRKAARAFLADALALDAEGELDFPTLMNPADCRLLAPVKEKLPMLAREVAPEHAMTDGALRAAFGRLLRAASARVYALDTTYYGPVADAVTSPLAERARRDVGWARHEDWIRGLFHREPIFSPDADETIPLSAVYHRLRCLSRSSFTPAAMPTPAASSSSTRALASISPRAVSWRPACGRRRPCGTTTSHGASRTLPSTGPSWSPPLSLARKSCVSSPTRHGSFQSGRQKRRFRR